MPNRNTGLLLLICIFIYGSQGLLYEGGNQFTQLLLFIVLAVSGYYLLKTVSSPYSLPKAIKYWILLLSLNIVGFLLTGSWSNSIHFGMFRGILISLLIFFPFYFLAQRGLFKKKYLIIFLLSFTPILILNWINQRAEIYNEYGREEIVINVSYTLVLLIPYLFLFERRKYIANILLILIMYFVILGSKRGAIIVGSIPVLFYIYQQIKFENLKRNFLHYIIGFASIIGLLFYAYIFIIQNEHLLYRFEQLEEGNSSGRDQIFTNIFNNWINSESIINIIFGYGFAGSLEISGKGLAHNDWLELLSNFGIVGVSIYFLFFYHAFKDALKINIDPQNKLMLLTILIMWLTTSFFSMGYVSNDGYLRSILLGYVLGIANQSRVHFKPQSAKAPIDNNTLEITKAPQIV